jgi:hypothetical protein
MKTIETGVGDILRSRESGSDQRKPRGHEHHEVPGAQRPRHVDADPVVAGEVGDLGRRRLAHLLSRQSAMPPVAVPPGSGLGDDTGAAIAAAGLSWANTQPLTARR